MRPTNTDDSTPPMRADARRNRARVLEAARVAFGAEGSNVSLDEIARRAGVGAGTVYRHFATKEALFEAVVVDRLGALAADARALSDDADPGPAFFAFVERLAREGARKRDVIEAFAHAGIDLQLGVAPALRELANALDETLRRAQDAGAVRTDISVDDVVAVVSGAAFAISQSRDDEDRIRTVLAITRDGLRSKR
jgi:AcrR family transcriptional regulator